jgi:septal ring factor EnvC (AmiA/AmiB activator)
MEMVHTIRRHWPNRQIIARARFRKDSQELQEAGVAHVFRETLDSSLKMGVCALRLLGENAYPAERSAAMFRELDEQTIRDVGKINKGKKYLSRARQFVEALEQQMIEEGNKGRQADPSWDPKALREDAAQLITQVEAAREKQQDKPG